ncbi:mechanosensitive ion channel family protein [Candidatus Lariskella endosymbiont of Hedychridium roseum]|uniref:mechanosensitive ion channel family protein n=1 Tax=Candidatus Lariskella endosymbiont of Hedychridium roseum TaxID=3077949 RepID=UPI0030CD708C
MIEIITNFLEKISIVFQQNTYFSSIVITLLCGTVGYIVMLYTQKGIKRLQNVFAARLNKSEKYSWYHKILVAAERPIQFVIFFFLISILVSIFSQNISISDNFLNSIGLVRDIAIVAAVTWFFLNFITQIEHHWLSLKDKKSNIDLASADLIVKILRVIVVIAALLMLMQVFGISVNGLLAFGGMSGIAVGFAAKDLLANLFGTVLIYFDKPFVVGESIKVIGSDVEGSVEAIGWRVTKIRTYEKRLVYIPNSIFSTCTVENASKMSHRRILENIIIRHEDHAAIESIVNDIRESLIINHDIDQSFDIIVNFSSATLNGLNIMIQCLVYETQLAKFCIVRQRIMTDVCRIITSHGASLAVLKNNYASTG